ncbi:ATP-binding protein [Sphingobacterium multivorum]|uniref:ATP-binding protein n=1 Tax=Sphingobacterium multivorum TaxID=28454 RepID=UPI00289FA5BF|nr:ATP-binding protein [Sphingobacterium multivorum]
MIQFFAASGNEALFDLLQQSTDPTAIYTGEDLSIKFANDAMLKIWNKDESIQDRSLADVFPELRGRATFDMLRDSWYSGNIVEVCNVSSTTTVNGKTTTLYYDYKYKPVADKAGKIYCILQTASDVTKRQEIYELLSNRGDDESTSKFTLQKEEPHSQNDHLDNLNDTISLLHEKLTTSEMSFRDLFTQSPSAMMLVKGDDYEVTMVNMAMLELLGKDVAIIGKPLFQEFPEVSEQKVAQMLVETYTNGVGQSDNAALVKIEKDGLLTDCFFNFSYTPFIENGKISGVICMAVDVTVQAEAIRRLEQTVEENISLGTSLRESEQRLRSILETMAEGVGVTDASGQMVYANPMAQRILGLKESEIKKRTYDDPQWQNLRIDGTPLPSEEHPMSIMLKTLQSITDHEIAVQPPNGDIIYLSINAAPMFDEMGVLTGGIGTFMDVTDRRRITQGKDDFISIASHELKTPVTSLKASLHLLQKRGMELSEEVKVKLVDQSVKSLDKLNVLINELLDTRRLEQGHLKLDKKLFALSELFEDCRANFTLQTTRKITFGGDLKEKVVADSHQIAQVMVNLINNAIKYAPESDIAVKVNKLDEKELMISIKDNGPGIPREKLSRLFERYYRTDYQGQKFSGLGLGLYICADIIKNHGGTIGVESEVGQGATFWFTLPL